MLFYNITEESCLRVIHEVNIPFMLFHDRVIYPMVAHISHALLFALTLRSTGQYQNLHQERRGNKRRVALAPLLTQPPSSRVLSGLPLCGSFIHSFWPFLYRP